MDRMNVPHKLLAFIQQNNMTQLRNVFENLDPQLRRLLDSPFTVEDLYILSTGKYILKYIDAYKTASREAELDRSVGIIFLKVQLLYT